MIIFIIKIEILTAKLIAMINKILIYKKKFRTKSNLLLYVLIFYNRVFYYLNYEIIKKN